MIKNSTYFYHQTKHQNLKFIINFRLRKYHTKNHQKKPNKNKTKQKKKKTKTKQKKETLQIVFANSKCFI